MARKFRCVRCHQFVVVSRVEPGEEIGCRYCGERITVPGAAEAASDEELKKYLRPSDCATAGASSRSDVGDFGASAASGVGAIAWLVLVLHIIVAIVIWVTIGTTEVPSTIYSGRHTAANNLGIMLGIAVLLEGVFFCVVLRCVHWIGRNVADLRRDTSGSRPN
jgi:DNA-directed RNA polymerase subunit RPC12/RpoP